MYECCIMAREIECTASITWILPQRLYQTQNDRRTKSAPSLAFRKGSGEDETSVATPWMRSFEKISEP